MHKRGSFLGWGLDEEGDEGPRCICFNGVMLFSRHSSFSTHRHFGCTWKCNRLCLLRSLTRTDADFGTYRKWCFFEHIYNYLHHARCKTFLYHSFILSFLDAYNISSWSSLQMMMSVLEPSNWTDLFSHTLYAISMLAPSRPRNSVSQSLGSVLNQMSPHSPSHSPNLHQKILRNSYPRAQNLLK